MEHGGEGDYCLGAEEGRNEIWKEREKHYGQQKLPWGGLGHGERTKTTIQRQPFVDNISRKWFGSVEGSQNTSQVSWFGASNRDIRITRVL